MKTWVGHLNCTSSNDDWAWSTQLSSQDTLRYQLLLLQKKVEWITALTAHGSHCPKPLGHYLADVTLGVSIVFLSLVIVFIGIAFRERKAQTMSNALSPSVTDSEVAESGQRKGSSIAAANRNSFPNEDTMWAEIWQRVPLLAMLLHVASSVAPRKAKVPTALLWALRGTMVGSLAVVMLSTSVGIVDITKSQTYALDLQIGSSANLAGLAATSCQDNASRVPACDLLDTYFHDITACMTTAVKNATGPSGPVRPGLNLDQEIQFLDCTTSAMPVLMKSLLVGSAATLTPVYLLSWSWWYFSKPHFAAIITTALHTLPFYEVKIRRRTKRLAILGLIFQGAMMIGTVFEGASLQPLVTGYQRAVSEMVFVSAVLSLSANTIILCAWSAVALARLHHCNTLISSVAAQPLEVSISMFMDWRKENRRTLKMFYFYLGQCLFLLVIIIVVMMAGVQIQINLFNFLPKKTVTELIIASISFAPLLVFTFLRSLWDCACIARQTTNLADAAANAAKTSCSIQGSNRDHNSAVTVPLLSQADTDVAPSPKDLITFSSFVRSQGGESRILGLHVDMQLFVRSFYLILTFGLALVKFGKESNIL